MKTLVSILFILLTFSCTSGDDTNTKDTFQGTPIVFGEYKDSSILAHKYSMNLKGKVKEMRSISYRERDTVERFTVYFDTLGFAIKATDKPLGHTSRHIDFHYSNNKHKGFDYFSRGFMGKDSFQVRFKMLNDTSYIRYSLYTEDTFESLQVYSSNKMHLYSITVKDEKQTNDTTMLSYYDVHDNLSREIHRYENDNAIDTVDIITYSIDDMGNRTHYKEVHSKPIYDYPSTSHIVHYTYY